MGVDLNKFEHSGQIIEGCRTGQHIPDDREGHIGIEKDGDFTKIIMKCLACGANIDVSAPLDINKFIGNNPQPQPSYQQPTQQTKQPDIGQSDILRRILG